VPQPNLNAPAYMPPPPTQSSAGVQPALTLQPYLAFPSISISSPSTPSNCVPTSAAQSADANATALGINALVNALETFAHASLSAVEMVHFAEPPTGTIQTLPGKLIITQSQAAHREIADLLKQLEEE
jgi:hypothetical protein